MARLDDLDVSDAARLDGDTAEERFAPPTLIDWRRQLDRIDADPIDEITPIDDVLNAHGPSRGGSERPAKEKGLTEIARFATVPRMVCVSTDYAGRVYEITRRELIVGRVEDNDIVIEHRSLSRNHMKILSKESGEVVVIDLESANGILVNGEEYAMTDLRANDLLELGHVKLRFIPPNVPFVPTDEEAAELQAAGFRVEAGTGIAPQPTAPARPVALPPDGRQSRDREGARLDPLLPSERQRILDALPSDARRRILERRKNEPAPAAPAPAPDPPAREAPSEPNALQRMLRFFRRDE